MGVFRQGMFRRKKEPLAPGAEIQAEAESHGQNEGSDDTEAEERARKVREESARRIEDRIKRSGAWFPGD